MAVGKIFLILSDGKAGHLNQCLTFARFFPDFETKVVQVRLRYSWLKFIFYLLPEIGILTPMFVNLLMRVALTPETSTSLKSLSSHMIISAGMWLEGLNIVLSQQKKVPNILLLKPSLPWRRMFFKLVVMPEHDLPPSRDNVLSIQGALCHVEAAQLRTAAQDLKRTLPKENDDKIYWGLFIGGDAKRYHLSSPTFQGILSHVEEASRDRDSRLLITTSPRTPRHAVQTLQSFVKTAPCDLLMVPETSQSTGVLGILELSSLLFVTEDSISMISEAVSLGKPVIILAIDRKSEETTKNDRFIGNLILQKKAYYAPATAIKQMISKVQIEKAYQLPPEPPLKTTIQRILASTPGS